MPSDTNDIALEMVWNEQFGDSKILDKDVHEHSEGIKPKCEHLIELYSQGCRHVETYKCIKCGELFLHHWYD